MQGLSDHHEESCVITPFATHLTPSSIQGVHATCGLYPHKFSSKNQMNHIVDHLFDKSIALDLPNEFYNHETNKCLIPVNKEFKFFRISK